MGSLSNGSGIFIFVASVIVVYFVYNSFKNRGIIHLSLSKFSLDPSNENQVIIEGRKTGIMQWFLVKLKLGNKYRIHVKKDHIVYSEDSASGKNLSLVPIHRVASTACGYKKPFGMLIIAIISLLIGIVTLFYGNFGSFFGTVVAAGIFFALYIYNKNFFISIESTGSTRLGFSFKRSFIENVSIETDKIEEAIGKINRLIIENK